MATTIQSPYTSEQVAAWLRGLLTIAWADGDFDETEQRLIADLTQDELAPKTDLGTLEPISPEDLVADLGSDATLVENFFRTAVMVAIADGIYTAAEDQVIQQFCHALGQSPAILESLRSTLQQPTGTASTTTETRVASPALFRPPLSPNPLHPVKDWLDELEVQDPRVARFLCKMIPSQCPFERNIKLFGRKVVHIPPLCKLNPLYEQLVGLRFRALSYLADECQEDVSPYI
ncbi:nitrogenase [Oculatella sp. LEGE 06141]|uniref:Mo-dependent nitrogenase C-terminal domain-containing protein n=1 Tax=Oculatella sp. LEGE 06141 TaxID=1828648 RepID=UPI0018801D1C|nr:Mo-dependent nitrogenase C-terminal domain-containing protein [Oculatella sp. LEGE 06141]MBE9177865.1 nitrogenase [Oculatella sp. LEGE 06141]